MHVPKATGELGERVKSAGEDELVDVVVELQAPAAGLESTELPRAQKIAARKSAFHEWAQPLSDLITSRGGQVTGEVWLNNTLQARVPARCLRELGAADVVSALDVARKLERD